MIVTLRRINLLQAWKRAGPPAPRTIPELQAAGAWGTPEAILQAFQRMARVEPDTVRFYRVDDVWSWTFTPMGITALGHIPTKD